jgi:hypothetical protein
MWCVIAAAAAAGVERRSNAPLAGKEVHVINYCCDKMTAAQREATKQRVGEMLARNGAKQVAAPLRTVSVCSAKPVFNQLINQLHVILARGDTCKQTATLKPAVVGSQPAGP